MNPFDQQDTQNPFEEDGIDIRVHQIGIQSTPVAPVAKHMESAAMLSSGVCSLIRVGLTACIHNPYSAFIALEQAKDTVTTLAVELKKSLEDLAPSAGFVWDRYTWITEQDMAERARKVAEEQAKVQKTSSVADVN